MYAWQFEKWILLQDVLLQTHIEQFPSESLPAFPTHSVAFKCVRTVRGRSSNLMDPPLIVGDALFMRESTKETP